MSEEIEVTPAMFDAGETVLLGNLGGAVSTMWEPGNLAVKVYRAMAASAWRPIETAPKSGKRILVSNNREIAATEFTNGRWVVSPTAWDGDGETGGLADLDFAPIHWRPLPEQPNASP